MTRWLIGLVLGASAAGCTSAAVRCQEISDLIYMADLHERNERRFSRDFSESLTSGQLRGNIAAARRAFRARRTMENRALLRESYPTDSALWRAGDPSADSAEPDPVIPPRPSELAWYAEHCHEGKAR